jgi:uncharacterized protein
VGSRSDAPSAENSILLGRASMVELYSAVLRRRREGSVAAEDCDVALRAFDSHCRSDYEFIELDLQVVTLARDLLERNSLRAYDAVQLA